MSGPEKQHIDFKTSPFHHPIGRDETTAERQILTDPKPEPLRSDHLASAGCGIAHGFFTRTGGVSQGLYDGLNVGLGSDDDPEHVAENRRRVAACLGVPSAPLTGPYQIHSADVITVSAPFRGERPKADGVVTATAGLPIGILTADCGPVLFADSEARVIGAAHAGWKGALTGVLENTVEAMEAIGAKRDSIKATLGPMISQSNYEVGPEFVDRFVSDDAANTEWFRQSKKPGHAMFDLPGYILDRLNKAGIAARSVDTCTYADEEKFFSYRRATHREEPDYGRQISAITLESI